MAENQKIRCDWCGDDPFYQHYHDKEWGVPQKGDQILFEKLLLEGFQAGLSWITILRKRENFRKAFDGFDAEKIARYSPKKVKSLMQDTGIVRNQAKIQGAITNAKAYLDLRETMSLSAFMWEFVDGTPVHNTYEKMSDIPAQTKTSQALSKALKEKGFRFCGPTIAYAHMQAMGMVNDHIITCHRHSACKELAKKFRAPKK